MCEWLVPGDWCDVHLLCGSRSFRAHRAVLASVSNFLKRVLLSCPEDESPLFIFLPEFDQDAMSSVLYYIYKGEVVVPHHKLQMFLDIANAIDVCIDQHYIPKMNDYIECYNSEGFGKEIVVKNNNMCHLNERQSRNCVNTYTGIGIEDFLCQVQGNFGNLNLSKNSLSHRQCSKNVSDLGNLISQSGFRQRQSFIRDIFIETYSRNGNGNGPTASVLAISNEHYRMPTSILSSNANGKHPSPSDTLSDIPASTSQGNSQITSTLDSMTRLHYFSNPKKNKYEQHELVMAYSARNKFTTNNFNIDCTLRNDSKNLNRLNLWKSHLNTEIPTQLFLSPVSTDNYLEKQCTSLNLSDIKETLDLGILSGIPKGCEASVVNNSCNTFKQETFDDACAVKESKSACAQSSRTTEKVTVILNKVLQSPWRPHQPNNYKPFRKKVRSLIHSQKYNEDEVNVEVKETIDNKASQIKINVHNLLSTEKYEPKRTVCQQVFTNSEAHNIHMRRHLSVRRYSCGECHKTFSQLRNFKYHMSIHRGTKEFATTCPVCGKYFNDRGYLSSHLKIHRNRKEYKCPSCPKSFNQRVAYNMHLRIHTGVKPHVCEECGKAFSRKMLLKQHQRTHSGERPYACTHCDKRFADRSNMTLHLRLHTGVKPFSCTLCPKSFTKKHHLKAHLNYHTGAKPYSCPRCKVAFTQSSNMRTHYKKCNA